VENSRGYFPPNTNVRGSAIHSPRRKSTLVILAALYWLAAPFVEAVYYSIEQFRGAYPVNADSISIPIFQFFVGWLIFSPMVALLIWWTLRSYPGSVPFLAFHRHRPIWGGLLWAATGAWLTFSLMFAGQSVLSAHWLDAIYQLASCYLALCFNGVLQAGGRNTSAPNHSLNSDAPTSGAPVS